MKEGRMAEFPSNWSLFPSGQALVFPLPNLWIAGRLISPVDIIG